MEMVNYLGRMIPRTGFRVFVYGPGNMKKLASSYEDYLSCLSNGWFSTKAEALEASLEIDEPPAQDLQSDYASYEKLDRKTKKSSK